MRPASDIIAEVSRPLRGMPVYLTGSLVAEEAYGLSEAHTDADLFCPSPEVLIAAAQRLLGEGYVLDDRMERVWHRWLRYGFNHWHTNSLKLDSPMGTEVNLVFKLVDKHPTTSLAQVIESFDFGLLAMGYETETGLKRDLRPYLFPGMDIDGPLPLMPNKREAWRGGFISQYNGIRECGRYAKYVSYGYDLSLVKEDLLAGYWAAAEYLSNRDKPEMVKLGKIYEAIAGHIEWDNIDELVIASKEMVYLDSLDAIMEALE